MLPESSIFKGSKHFIGLSLFNSHKIAQFLSISIKYNLETNQSNMLYESMLDVFQFHISSSVNLFLFHFLTSFHFVREKFFFYFIKIFHIKCLPYISQYHCVCLKNVDNFTIVLFHVLF